MATQAQASPPSETVILSGPIRPDERIGPLFRRFRETGAEPARQKPPENRA
jgi:hypothetical protein